MTEKYIKIITNHKGEIGQVKTTQYYHHNNLKCKEKAEERATKWTREIEELKKK